VPAPIDEEYWRRYRERAQRRAGATGLLVIGPLGILVAIMLILAPMDYPIGDLRNDLGFRLGVYGTFIAFDLVLINGSVRLLRDSGNRQG
jgi:hypothetical protein